MDTGLVVAIVTLVVIAVLLVLFLGQRQRTQRLQQQFGPEYQRTVARAGDQRAAESQLTERQGSSMRHGKRWSRPTGWWPR